MTWLTIDSMHLEEMKESKESHFDRIKKIHPSTSKDEYDRWIKAGIRL